MDPTQDGYKPNFSSTHSGQQPYLRPNDATFNPNFEYTGPLSMKNIMDPQFYYDGSTPPFDPYRTPHASAGNGNFAKMAEDDSRKQIPDQITVNSPQSPSTSSRSTVETPSARNAALKAEQDRQYLIMLHAKMNMEKAYNALQSGSQMEGEPKNILKNAKLSNDHHNLRLSPLDDRDSIGSIQAPSVSTPPAGSSAGYEKTASSSSERLLGQKNHMVVFNNYPKTLDECVSGEKLDLIMVGKHLEKVRLETSEECVQKSIRKFVATNYGIESKCSVIRDTKDVIYASNGQMVLNLLNARHMAERQTGTDNKLLLEVVQPSVGNITDIPMLPDDVEWPFKAGQNLSFEWFNDQKVGSEPHKVISYGIQRQLETMCEQPEFPLYFTRVKRPSRKQLDYDELKKYEANETNTILLANLTQDGELPPDQVVVPPRQEAHYQKASIDKLKQFPDSVEKFLRKIYRQLLGLDHHIFKRNMTDNPNLQYEPVFVSLSTEPDQRMGKYTAKREAYEQFENYTFRLQLFAALNEYRRSKIFVDVHTGARRVEKNKRNNEKRKLDQCAVSEPPTVMAENEDYLSGASNINKNTGMNVKIQQDVIFEKPAIKVNEGKPIVSFNQEVQPAGSIQMKNAGNGKRASERNGDEDTSTGVCMKKGHFTVKPSHQMESTIIKKGNVPESKTPTRKSARIKYNI